MEEKISTLILTVDLDCHLCYKKIKKALCKLQDREHIQKIAYDKKNKTVTISGPFDPNKMKKMLCRKACRVIKDSKIEEEDNPVQKDINMTEPGTMKPDPVYLPFWPVGPIAPTIPVCCWRPYYVGYNDSCRCCTCGCQGAEPPPLPAVGKPVTYHFSCDCEEVPPPCSIM